MITPARRLPESLLDYVEDRYIARSLELSEGGAEQLRIAARAFERIVGVRPIERIDGEAIEVFLRQYAGEGVRPATVASKRGQLLSVLRHAKTKGRLGVEVPEDVARPRVPETDKGCPTPDELARVLAVCRSWSPPARTRRVNRCWTARHWQGLIRLVYETGERIAAVLAARRSWLDAGRMTLAVPAEVRKGRLSGRTFDLKPATVELLVALPNTGGLFAREDDPRLFPAVRIQTLRAWLKDLLEAAELPNDRRRLFHSFRRTTATVLTDKLSIDAAAEQLGHSSPRLTRTNYVDATQLTRKTRTCDVLPDLSGVQLELF